MAGIKRTGKLMGAPRYTIGDIIDISYKQKSGLPDRIKIVGITAQVSDGGNMWMYSAVSELYGDIVSLPEKHIETYTINYNLPCYKVPQVQYMYSKGFRFCGNFPNDEVGKKMCEIINESKSIQRIVACVSYDKSGTTITSVDRQGIWVKYKNSLDVKEEFAPEFTRDITCGDIDGFRGGKVPYQVFIDALNSCK